MTWAACAPGRASTALLDPVHVEVYGANMPLNQVATVSVPEAAHAVGAGVGPLERPAGRKGDPQRRARASTRSSMAR